MFPIRSLLRDATAAAHGRLDDVFTHLNLGRRTDYCTFLAAHASVIPPLETAADRAGAGQVLRDWPGRRRSCALLDDLAALGMQPPPPLPLAPAGGPAWALGVLYVLEGSRLGARVLRSRVLAGRDAGCGAATAYLSHGMMQPLWPSFLAQLGASPHARGDAGSVVAGAQYAFAAFERAAPLRAETRDIADAAPP